VRLRTARACHGEKYPTLSRLHTHTVSGNSFEDDENRRQIGEDPPPALPFYLLWRVNMPMHLLQVTSERFEEMAEGGENSPQYVLAASLITPVPPRPCVFSTIKRISIA
jgi:hypothetical protein